MQNKFFCNFTVNGLTNVGCVREHNEDNILIDEELGLLLVADGMGGHQAGEIASMEAIKIIRQMLKMQERDLNQQNSLSRLWSKFQNDTANNKLKERYLVKALYEANRHIYQLNLERNAWNGTGMGTTVAGCWILSADKMLVFHVGDSRVYRFRNQKMEGLTKDHSVLQKWHELGCIGEKPKSNIIINAIGPFPESVPEVQTVIIENSDAFLICSDGLTDMLDDEDIEGILSGLTADKTDYYNQKLLLAALKKGGKDNVSIILMNQGNK